MLKVIKSPNDIAFFNGIRVKRIFDIHNTQPHLLLSSKTKNVRSWKSLKPYFQFLANATNQSYQYSSSIHETNKTPYGIHIHNEHKLGDLLLLVLKDYARLMKLDQAFTKHAKVISPLHLTTFHQAMDLNQPPMVFTNTVDENWGFLSSRKCDIC